MVLLLVSSLPSLEPDTAVTEKSNEGILCAL